MQPCFKDQVVEICHFCSDICHPGLCCSAIPISGTCAICENKLSYHCQGMIQVFVYLFSVEVDAIVCPKHKLCFEYQNTGNKTKLTAMVRSKRLVHSPASQA